jgi:protein-disulfide isomerase
MIGSCALVVAITGCDKSGNKPNDTGAISAMDRAGSGSVAEGPVDTTPLPGVDISKLPQDKQSLFYKLIGSLKSPCGKTHSLRTSFSSDNACKRAPYAVAYVQALLEDEASEADLKDLYAKKYDPAPAKLTLDVSKAPRFGPEDAPIQLIEFFDYACPHCQTFAPVLQQVAEKQQGKVVEYFMMFPLEKAHPNSRSAARAALAAAQQGKFKEMHQALFEKSPAHTKDAVMSYAKALGLDMAKFEADYAAADTQVNADLKQGEAAGVSSTPTLYFNGRTYEGPMYAKYLELWITEELAVNR